MMARFSEEINLELMAENALLSRERPVTGSLEGVMDGVMVGHKQVEEAIR